MTEPAAQPGPAGMPHAGRPDRTAGVSYVLTVFNKRPFLPLVLPAILAEQRSTGGEIILVDDGSDDGSARQLEEFAARCPAVRVLRQRNAGVASASNLGLAAAGQPLVRLLDADDVPVPGSTRRLQAALEATDADLAYGGMLRYHLGQPLPAMPPPVVGMAWALVPRALRAVLTNNEIVPSTTLVRHRALDAVLPLVEDIRTAQDFQLAARLAQRGAVVRLGGAPVCWFAAAAGNRLSASVGRMYADTCRLVGRHLDGPFAWPAAEAQFAARRNAARTRRFARRHLRLGWRQWLDLEALAWRVRLPGYRPCRADLAFLAGIYGE
ncbi:glycosyltransferase [Paeniroseomonas aquatica]|uniref:Glycosyltransferase n=1 Tax=Paeniroseomonas aquatica TaxID=373043 RepID=A0ABT8AFN6_9PROT|nr:glycosyltransferase [Paeniroseomonas aquatica]MDN3568169.1 glycosyltransferase [Paeniroseomonas aquatica]